MQEVSLDERFDGKKVVTVSVAIFHKVKMFHNSWYIENEIKYNMIANHQNISNDFIEQNIKFENCVIVVEAYIIMSIFHKLSSKPHF